MQDIEKLLQPTKFDMAIASFFPKWGANRMQARRMFAYEASRNTRLRASATRLQGPEDFTAFTDRLGLIRQVRDLESNFGLFQSIIDKLSMYAFGRITYQSRTGDKATDDSYEEYLLDRFSRCDLSGKHNLSSFARIAFKSTIRDGDFAFQWVPTVDGLKLSGIEGDRIGGNVAVNGREDYMQGIFIDTATGKPISYKIFRRTKANAYVDPVEVLARDIIHYFDPRRYDQFRGITPFAPVVNEARDLKEVLEACLIGTKFENYHAAIGYTDSGLPLNDPQSFIQGTETMANGSKMTEQEIKYGVMQWAPSGSKVDFIKSDRPSANFQSYLDMLVRLQGVALNLPYGFIYSMIGNGPAVRMEMQQAHRTIQYHQEIAQYRMLNPIADMYLMEGFASGDIKYNPRWKKRCWQFPPAVSIDAGRDSAAGIAEVNAGLMSKSTWYAENGEDAEEQEVIIQQEADRLLTAAKALSEKHSIPIDMALTLLSVRTPNGFLANRTATVAADDTLEAPEAPTPEAKPAEPAKDNTEEVVGMCLKAIDAGETSAKNGAIKEFLSKQFALNKVSQKL